MAKKKVAYSVFEIRLATKGDPDVVYDRFLVIVNDGSGVKGAVVKAEERIKRTGADEIDVFVSGVTYIGQDG